MVCACVRARVWKSKSSQELLGLTCTCNCNCGGEDLRRERESKALEGNLGKG